MNNEPVAYGMLTFCKNCGEQNPYSLREITDEEIDSIGDEVSNLIDTYAGRREFARAILRKAQEK
jgi:hypothetical protein